MPVAGRQHLAPAAQLPPWRTVYKQAQAWHEAGTWECLLTGLRQQVRQLSHAAQPLAGAIDSRSVGTGGKRGAAPATLRVGK